MIRSRHARNKKLAQSSDQKTTTTYFTRQTVIWTAVGRLSTDLNICVIWDVTRCRLVLYSRSFQGTKNFLNVWTVTQNTPQHPVRTQFLIAPLWQPRTLLHWFLNVLEKYAALFISVLICSNCCLGERSASYTNNSSVSHYAFCSWNCWYLT